MKRYSVQPRDRIFVKGYGFLSFAKNVGRSVGKNISKILSGKYCQRRLDNAKNLLQMYLKLLQNEQFKKKTEETCDLICNTIADKITKISKILPHNNSETGTNEEERYISPEKKQLIINIIYW